MDFSVFFVFVGDYGVNKRTNGERGSCFWFSIPYEPMQDKAMQLLKTAKESISSSLANQNSVSVVVEGGESTNNSTALISSPRVIRSANIESNIGIGSGGYFKEPLRVLVVEDSMVISKMIKLLLTRHGHVVFTAENGQEAVNFIRDQPSQDETNPYKTNVDIILMDFQMPIMGGIEATRLIRQWEAKQLGFAHNDVLPYQPPNNFQADGSNSSSIEQRLLSEASNTACGPSHKRRLSRVRTSFQTQLSPVEEYLPTSSQGGGGGGGIANGDNSVRSSSRSAGSSSGTGSGSYRKGNNANSNSNAILSAMEQAVKNVEKDELTVVDIESNPSQQIVTASPKHSFGLSGIQEEENEFMSPPSNRSQPHKSISTASVVHHGNTMSSFAALENHIHPSQANTTNNNASFSVDQKYLLINRTPTMRSSAMFTSATTLRSDSGFFNGSMPSFLAPGSYPTSENLPSGEVASSSDKTSDLNHGERSKQFIKIIGFSAKSDYEVINEGYIAGMDAFIAKPFAIKSFYETYAQLCIQDLR